jgi:hypothetical protein
VLPVNFLTNAEEVHCDSTSPFFPELTIAVSTASPWNSPAVGGHLLERFAAQVAIITGRKSLGGIRRNNPMPPIQRFGRQTEV